MANKRYIMYSTGTQQVYNMMHTNKMLTINMLNPIKPRCCFFSSVNLDHSVCAFYNFMIILVKISVVVPVGLRFMFICIFVSYALHVYDHVCVCLMVYYLISVDVQFFCLSVSLTVRKFT